MKAIQDTNSAEWNRLIHYHDMVETRYKYDNVRQDVMERGLKSEYTKEHLTQNVSLSATFNPLTHYDLSQYLTKLVLVSHEIDDKFQFDIQRIFEVNQDTKVNQTLGVLYMRGPVKTLERCYAKCQSDYREQKFPTSARLLDIVRCSLIFQDVTSMLIGMDLFQRKLKHKENEFCIVEVVRVKNGFVDYSHEAASYTDIKFNVMIRGKEYSVIGEIQFLFKEMFDYKHISHSLYSIERRTEFVSNMAKILPTKLDLKKQLFIHAARNNIDGINDLMVTHNFEKEALLQLNQRNQSILTPVCQVNCSKVLNYLIEMIPNKVIREMLIFPDATNKYPLSLAISNNHHNGVLKCIMHNDRFALANYEHNHNHILSNCWVANRGKCALLILQTLKPDIRIQLIERDVELYKLTKCGDGETLDYVLNEIKDNKALKDQFMNKSIHQFNGKYSNFHDVAAGGFDGGSVQSMKVLLKYCENEEQRQALWTKEDSALQLPLYHAIIKGRYHIVEWMLHQMNDTQKQEFFQKPNLHGDRPITKLIASKSSNKEVLKTLNIAVTHLTSAYEKKFHEIMLYSATHNQVDTAQIILNKTSNESIKREIINYRAKKTLNTALHEAAIKNNVDFVRYLLDIIEDDNEQLIAKNIYQRNALMEAANVSALRITRMILDKVAKSNRKYLNTILSMKSQSDLTVIDFAIRSKEKNNEKCAKIIMSYYDENSNMESIFLPCLQLGDMKLAESIWNKTNDDAQLRNKLWTTTNKDGYNCFLLVAKNGNYDGLKWLLSLNDDQKDEAEQDEKNLMTKHATNGRTPLLLCVSNDVRKPLEDTQKKALTQEEKENYFKCVQLMLDSVAPGMKPSLLLECDNEKKNCLMWCCTNGNIETARYILQQCDEKTKKLLIDPHRPFTSGVGPNNCFGEAIIGGNMKLIQMIYDVYKSYEMEKELMKDATALKLAFKHGYSDIIKWLLFEVVTDSTQRTEFLNQSITSTKSGRKCEENVKKIVIKILENELMDIEEEKDIDNINKLFEWMMQKQKSPNDLYCVDLILSKLKRGDDAFKKQFFEKVNCLGFACTNRVPLLKRLLIYLDTYYAPLLTISRHDNALLAAITARSETCVALLFQTVKDSDIKDQLIETKDVKNNALIHCVKQKNKKLIELIVQNHSSIEPILGVSFRTCLFAENLEAAKFLLSKSKQKSLILNEKGEHDKTVLHYALEKRTDVMLKFIVEQLKSSEAEERKDAYEEMDGRYIHPMYFSETIDKRNIFHILLASESSMDIIHTLESVLNKEMIQKLLLRRNNADQLPIHTIHAKIEKSIVEWTLNQFEDPLQIFKMIVERNKFGGSMWLKITDKALQRLFANKLIECLRGIHFDKVDIITLKDTFRNTLTWKQPSLQSFILDKIDKNKHEFLLNPEHMIEVKRSIVTDLLDIDDPAMANVILPVLTNEKLITLRDGVRGENALLRCLAFARGNNVIKLILGKITNKDLLFKMAIERTGGASPLFFAYRYKDQLLNYILSLIPDEKLYDALDEAVPEDDDMNYVNALLSRVQSQDTQHKMLRKINRNGETLFFRAAWMKRKEVLRWFVGSQMKSEEDVLFFITTPGHLNLTMPLYNLVDKTDLIDIFETTIKKLKPKQIIDHLLYKSFTQSCIVSKSKNKDFQLKLAEIIEYALNAMDPIDDIDVLGPLFMFGFERLKDIKVTEMVLSKSAKTVQPKLFMNHVDHKNHNVLIRLLGQKDKKDMIHMFLKHMDCGTKHNVLNDIENPNINKRGTALQTVCAMGSMENFKLIAGILDETKQDFDQELIKLNHKNESLLYETVKSNHVDLVSIILSKIKTDSQKMSMLNQKTKKGKNIFDVVKSNNIKQLLKKTIGKILTNIAANTIGFDTFIPYFHWLCKENDMESIKQLLVVFNNDKHNFISHIFANKQNVFHICCAKDYAELLEFFLNALKDEKQLNLFSNKDENNKTPLLHASHSKKCLSIVLKQINSVNPKLLSEMYLDSDPSLIERMVTGTQKETLKEFFKYCNRRILTEELVIELLHICGWKAAKDEKREIILSKASEIGLNLKTLFCSEDIILGTIPLYSALLQKNDKLVDSILKDYVDLDDKKEIEYLISYQTYMQRNLLHAAGDLKSAQKIMDLCQFQKDRDTLLLQKDIDGDTPLQVLISKISAWDKKRMNENKEWIQFYLGLVKKDDIRSQLLCDKSFNGLTTIAELCRKVQSITDGLKLYKDILSNIKASNANDIPLWAEILQSTLTSIPNAKDALELVKMIVGKFDFDAELQRKLLTYSGPHCRNVFETVSGSSSVKAGIKRLLLIYFLTFVDDTNNDILIKQDHKGCCPIYNFVQAASEIEPQMMLQTFDTKQIGDILLMETNAHKSIIAVGSPKFLSLCIPKFTDEQLIQLFIENTTNKKLFQILFYYIQELSDRFVPKLMKARRRSDGMSFLSVIIQELTKAGNQYLWNWIAPYFKELNDEQRIQVLTDRDYLGNTPLSHCAKYIIHTGFITEILALYPNREVKQRVILQQNNVGDSPFYIAMKHSRWMVAYTLWNAIESDTIRLQMVNVNSSLFKSYANATNWKKWTKELFNTMKDQYVDDVQLLIPSFYSAIKTNDARFAKLIISKMDLNNKEKVIEFVTSKTAVAGETILHFIAHHKTPEITDIVLQLIDNSGYGWREILLDEGIIRNKEELTPLMIAVTNDNPEFISTILSKMKQKDKSKLILLEAKKKLTVDKRNWNNKAVHKINVNAIIKALVRYMSLKDMTCLNALLENCDETKAIIKYTNNNNQTLYHYLLSIEMAQHFKTKYKLPFTFTHFSHADVDGRTPFMAVIKKTNSRQKNEFIEWILDKCCANNEERVRLIYQYDNEGLNALDMASGPSLNLLTNTLKAILSSYKQIKDFNLMIPFFLYALKEVKLSLAKRLLSMLNSNGDKRKVICGHNSFGVNAVLSSLKRGGIGSLKWLMIKQSALFDESLIFAKDKDGLGAIHYAVASQNTVCLKEILSIYQRHNKGSFKELMFTMVDNKGNLPFTYFVQNHGLYAGNKKFFHWILSHLNHDIHLKMRMFFAKNTADQCPLVEAWNRHRLSTPEMVSVHIQEYFSNIESINDSNIEFAGYSLLFLSRFDCLSIMKLIIRRINNKDLLYKALNVTNSDNDDVLYSLVYYKKMRNFKWFLDAVVPMDHPTLYTQNKHNGLNTLQLLIRDGYLGFAEVLIQKISDKKIKWSLLQSKNDENESILDYAKQRNVMHLVNWIETHLNDACK